VTRSLAYSPTGNVASDNRGNGTALSFTYDLSDRMVQVANQNTPLATYAYNYLGQRAAKTTSSAITQFVYDRSGHLLAESNGATGAAQTEYVWFDDMPLALVTGGNLYFLHSDQLNTPQKATDISRNLAWDIVARPFGQTEQQTFPPLSNLRFPGQYFDSESGLAQNWFRDYDPSIGRYIESDPVGISYDYSDPTILAAIDPFPIYGNEAEADINHLYGYVAGNPLNAFDALGLAGRKGERGATGGSSGQRTDNPYKHCREIAGDPDSIECKHPHTGKWIKKKKPADWNDYKSVRCEACSSTASVVVIGGVAYIIYRCVRMLPSLAPPLWWTIPANVAAP
jgi:RHS repeat-associated protein